MKNILTASAVIFTGAFYFGQIPLQAGPNDSVWIQLFNKADTSLFTNWDIHIAGQQLNVDPRNTFSRTVVGSDTVLDVNTTTYSNWTGNPWGHIGYKVRSFKYFLVRAQHQFYGSQPSGAPTWALQNNGIMMGQAVAAMGVNQDYPISLENQLLGPNNVDADNNSTANLCTPGTAFYTTLTGGTVNTTHCTSAATISRANAAAPNWLTVSALVMSDSIIRHYVEGQLALTYYRPVQYSGNVSGNTVPIVNNTPIKEFYISLQSESAPTRFRKVELLNLEGCMTTTDANYKTYFVKNDPTLCGLPAGITVSPQMRTREIFTLSGNRIQATAEILNVTVYDMKGAIVASLRGEGLSFLDVKNLRPGLYGLRVHTVKGSATVIYAGM